MGHRTCLRSVAMQVAGRGSEGGSITLAIYSLRMRPGSARREGSEVMTAILTGTRELGSDCLPLFFTVTVEYAWARLLNREYAGVRWWSPGCHVHTVIISCQCLLMSYVVQLCSC